METKQHACAIGLGAGMLAFLGFIACGTALFNLNHTLQSQRQVLSETRSQLADLKQVLASQQHELSETRQQLADAARQIVAAQSTNQWLAQHLTGIPSKIHGNEDVAKAPVPPVHIPAPAPDFPAPDSIEGKLRTEGKIWERINGPPIAGGYVQDIMQGRLNQPKGRGSLGMVLSMAANPEGKPVATVDFGHGYVVGIAASELVPVRLVGPDAR
jgi:hypothetical protein